MGFLSGLLGAMFGAIPALAAEPSVSPEEPPAADVSTPEGASAAPGSAAESVAPPTSATAPQAPTPLAEPLPETRQDTAPRPPGTLELRLQTVSNVAGSGVFAVTTTPGFAYDFGSDTFIINLVGGVGYFFDPSFAAGLDASFTRVGGNQDVSLFALSPFAKFVTGETLLRPGFFAELSPGWVGFQHGGLHHYLQLNGWLGAHIPVGTWVALLLGPSATFIIPFESGEDAVWLLGVRLGLSVYL